MFCYLKRIISCFRHKQRSKIRNTVIEMSNNEWISLMSMECFNILRPKIWKNNEECDVNQIFLWREYNSQVTYHLVPELICVWKCKDKYYIYSGINTYLAFKDSPELQILVKFIDSQEESRIIRDSSKIKPASR